MTQEAHSQLNRYEELKQEPPCLRCGGVAKCTNECTCDDTTEDMCDNCYYTYAELRS